MVLDQLLLTLVDHVIHWDYVTPTASSIIAHNIVIDRHNFFAGADLR